MPVHRHLHNRMGSVYASRAELDTWARSRNLRAEQQNGNNAPSSNPPDSPPRSATSAIFARWRFLLALAAAGAALAIGTSLWLQRTEYFWRNPIADARFQTITGSDGVEQAAAVSRDGHFVAFLSDRDGPMDVWVTQVGSGQFHNLTTGARRNSSIHRCAHWGSRPTAPWLHFGVASKTVQAAATLAFGRYQPWVDNQNHTWRVWRSLTGPPTAPVSYTTRPAQETRCS